MMLAALRAAGLDKAGIAAFLHSYSRYWSRYASEKFAASWPAGLERERPRLTRIAAAVLSGRSGSPPIDVLERWSGAVRTALASLDARGDEILPQVSIVGASATKALRRDLVLFNYLHTHNNRFGVLPVHESYLAYLGHHVVRGLAR